MAEQDRDLRTVIREQNKIIEKLTYDNRQLVQRLQELQHLEHISRYNIEKSREAFEVASHNAGRIIMKAVDFSYAFKDEIAVLLEAIDDHRHNPQNVLKVIDEFLERNKRIYAFSINDGERITEMIKKEIINKIR
ncbi:MAG: hypothetical protein EIB84_01570 [Spiroplasma poulsonii]|uniref:Uncharacterized protein n=1 Tax=Spiroplasma poulsonii TaxID=2138 RepID=A0A2P6FCB7_9MOLU|nr:MULTISPECIES: hypothetical protein [Spiroplasma]KAF0851519.1 hypothetical protein MSROBK_009480 [Spiroplasma poulsonii]MBH8622712.1 hypothetical protein [Spiroplasma sp. hyd1]MBW1241582.1 hypothetical protein [Spiroplasma poulsonii]PQM31113.1 hypothetical protein SMSRO_SF009130 [Spiroplasma poulsonii]PWF96112.1 hypothetical protein SMSE_15500 [Spiroplasma poulsonii]